MNCKILQDEIKNGAIVIDVRSRQEYVQGHIENAINIPVDDIYHDIDKVDTTRTIYIHCQSGMRSQRAAQLLRSKGVNVIDLSNISRFSDCII